jgi:type IV secretory pathway VirD2 relaxase
VDDFEFEPRLGRPRRGDVRRGRKYLGAVMAAAKRAGFGRRRGRGFVGSRLGRGAVAARALAMRSPGRRHGGRRAIVKVRLVRLGPAGLGAAIAHLRYVQRDGVGRNGGVGELYAERDDAADGRAFLQRCEGDRHQFRFIVSAEDGAAYEDLRPLIRRFMARMEEDLGTALDWVAADHADTAHPHTHVILRGKDGRGENLVIAPEYIAHGMRERVCELVSLDLGPVTGREIEDRQRLEVGAERFTGLDRRLLRARHGAGVVVAGGGTLFEQALRAGRLRKLEALGLAENLGAGRWRLDEELEGKLRDLGERGDIVRTMQRALNGARLERAPARQAVFAPRAGETLVGRVIARGLADEHRDRHYLVVDGLDGRAHYAAIGAAGAVEPLPDGAVVRLSAAHAGVRESDRTIVAVAAASGGRYDAARHRRHDPVASPAFVAAHVRRLEALRRGMRLERDADGTWSIRPDYLERVARYEGRRARERPVQVELLSPVPVEALPEHDGATWLDETLAAGEALPARDAGFGRDVRGALALRRRWLLGEGLAVEKQGEFAMGDSALASLRRRELLRVASRLAAEEGKVFVEAAVGARVEGVVSRRLDLASGRFGLVEGAREFTLVPWRPVLARAMGSRVSGIVREAGTSWTIGRNRGIER